MTIASIAKKTVKVTDYGGVADGRALNTQAIARAIDALAQGGGGTLVFPKGDYLTGPVIFRNGIELHVEEGAVVRFSQNCSDYPVARFERAGEVFHYLTSPLYAQGVEDISITGPGRFDGQGEPWRPLKRFKLTPEEWRTLTASGKGFVERDAIWHPNENEWKGREKLQAIRDAGREPTLADYEAVRECMRPNLLRFVECRGIVLDGPTFGNAPSWNLQPWLCSDITVRNIRVVTPWNAQNGDGIDFDSCSNVTLSDSEFDVGDDCVCIKSGKDEVGRRIGVPCENITVRNCIMHHGHGGIVVGSETSGGVRNLDVDGCDFRGTDVGLRFKTMRGRGGVVENIHIRNIRMANIKKVAILFSMFYHDTPPEPFSERTPVFRNFDIRQVRADGANQAVLLRGLPEMPIQNITLEDVRIRAKRGVSCIDGLNVRLIDCAIEAEEGPALELRDTDNFNLSGFRTRIID